MKLSKKAATYLRLIGERDGYSVPLTKGFTKPAQELKNKGLAIYIPISSGGCHVALTQEGVDLYEANYNSGESHAECSEQ